MTRINLLNGFYAETNTELTKMYLYRDRDLALCCIPISKDWDLENTASTLYYGYCLGWGAAQKKIKNILADKINIDVGEIE